MQRYVSVALVLASTIGVAACGTNLTETGATADVVAGDTGREPYGSSDARAHEASCEEVSRSRIRLHAQVRSGDRLAHEVSAHR